MFKRNDPAANTPPPLQYISDANVTSTPILGVGIQGSTSTTAKTLIPIDQYMSDGVSRYIDLFTPQNGTTSYNITSNVTYISINPSSGTLSSSGVSDAEAYLTVDWKSAPAGWSYTNISITGSGAITALVLPIHKASPLSSFRGFVESAGAIAIEPEHYKSASSSHEASYTVLPNFGRTLSDGNTSSAIQPVPNTTLGIYPSGWTNAVDSDTWTVNQRISVDPGAHILTVSLLEPGLVLQMIVIDVGGLQSGYLGPPESVLIEDQGKL
ncbi:hypothetical protein EIK77_002363 [Talaromyces pinophilus]|nr:hypothetical protein EIK77_002363 [Talaromyces pinophilus]